MVRLPNNMPMEEGCRRVAQHTVVASAEIGVASGAIGLVGRAPGFGLGGGVGCYGGGGLLACEDANAIGEKTKLGDKIVGATYFRSM